jgi:hypothetical protein
MTIGVVGAPVSRNCSLSIGDWSVLVVDRGLVRETWSHMQCHLKRFGRECAWVMLGCGADQTHVAEFMGPRVV